jgi:hypothetical protein
LQADENETGTEDTAAETAQMEENPTQVEEAGFRENIGGNDLDPEVMLQSIQKRRTEREALFGASPLKPLHDDADAWHERLYQKTHIKLGTSVHHLLSWLSESFPGTDDWGTARRCWIHRAGLRAQCGFFPLLNTAGGLPGECLEWPSR